jgi:preprotein translocase subunit YajC
MKAIVRILSFSLFGLFGAGLPAHARPSAFQEAPPPQNPAPPQAASAPQTPPRGERRPGLFGKLTAVRDQSIEIATQNGATISVKISGTTQFRKDQEAAKLSDFKVGDVIFVRGQENADHTWTAEVIGQRSGGGFGGRGGSPGGTGPGAGGPGGGRPVGVLGQDYVFGEVKAIDAPKLTILRPDNVTQSIELNEETSLRKGRDSITMADIQVGDHIMVRGGMKDSAFQPKSVMVIGPEQWKRMQEMGMAGGQPPNAPKDNPQPQKPPEPPH